MTNPGMNIRFASGFLVLAIATVLGTSIFAEFTDEEIREQIRIEEERREIEERELQEALLHTPAIWTNDGAFHRLVSQADRVVIRDGGLDCCGPVDGQRALIVLTNLQDITEFNRNIQFVATEKAGFDCLCCGFPGIDWFQGSNRLALSSVKHGKALSWKGFPCNVSFTDQSSVWLMNWCLEHGTNGMFREFEARKAKEEGRPSP